MPGRRMTPTMRRPSTVAVIASVGGLVLIVGTAALLLFNSGPRVHLEPGDAPTPPAATTASADQEGYLAPSALSSVSVVPPPPAPGSARAEADRKVFLATRAMEGSPRWALAASDNDQSIGATLQDFSCALWVQVDAASAPATVQLFTRLVPDAHRTVEAAKQTFNRKRPFLLDPGAICTLKTDELAKSPDYPSGHSSWGWMAALIFAEIAPDHATQVLARGRAYGESRVVCGVHTPSAVEAGRVNGAALVAALHASNAFRGDLDQARAEIAGLRSSGHAPDAGKCDAEARLISIPAY
jgi:acid phosphatase (class A)